jgi:hypothetical protein
MLLSKQGETLALTLSLKLRVKLALKKDRLSI